MSVGVSVAADGVRPSIAGRRVEMLVRAVVRAEGVRHALISVAFVRPAAIARINRTYLGRRGRTDVIAFALGSGPADAAFAVGDIYICPDVARRNARAWGVPIRQELARLVVHGVLHVLGHDHPDGDARVDSPMWRRQERLVRRFATAAAGTAAGAA